VNPRLTELLAAEHERNREQRRPTSLATRAGADRWASKARTPARGLPQAPKALVARSRLARRWRTGDAPRHRVS